MPLKIINPFNNQPLGLVGDSLVDDEGTCFPLIKGAFRFVGLENYTNNFGLQWHVFRKTQLDHEFGAKDLSSERFFRQTEWLPKDLAHNDILEVGSGAGRFSKVVLEHTAANLYSLDYSDSVTANFQNNGQIAPERFYLFQASIYEMPFADDSFDKVFCFGVLQHTPNFENSVKALLSKTKPGGEIAIDFYPINGWWTKVHAKYLLRPFTKRLPHNELLRLINTHIDRLVTMARFLDRIGLHVLTRFLPLVDLNTIPRGMSTQEFREWVVLDTFDMFSPEFDSPQRISDVVAMLRRLGALVTFSGFVGYSDGFKSAVVRAVKQK